jgi:hypothetical protein
VASLEQQVARMERLLTASPAEHGSPVEERHLDPVAIEPLGEVVSRDSLAAVDDDISPAVPATLDWVPRRDTELTPAAFASHDRFDLEQRGYRQEEEIRRIAAAQATAEAGERPTVGSPPPARLAQLLGTVQVASGAYTDYEDVQVWPLVLDPALQSRTPPLLDPEEAVLKGELVVTYDPAAETVFVHNSSKDHAALLMAGDILRGARQDRVAEQDLFLLPGQKYSVRTRTTGPPRRTKYKRYLSAPGLAPAGLRALLAPGVGQKRFDAASLALMSDIASSPGSSLGKVYGNDRVTKIVDKQLQAFTPRLDDASVVGFAVAVGPHVIGVEVFGDHATFVSSRKRVLRSYLLDAYWRDPDDAEATASRRSDVSAILATAAQRGAFVPGTQVAAGVESVFESPAGGPFGYGVFGDNGLVHATVHPHSVGGSGVLGGGGTGGGQDVRGGVGRPETGRTEPGDGPKRGSESEGGGFKPK